MALIFQNAISYASENCGIAEEIYFALVGDGHEVFFDRPSLKPGDNYARRLREAIGTADGVIFLISPESVQGGGYALTELKYTRQRWAYPEKRVLPVMVKPTRFEAIPAYLRSVTILQPEGNIAAEVVEAVNGWGKSKPYPAGRKDLFQEAGKLFKLVVSSLFVTVGLGTLFSLFYPRVEINLGLTEGVSTMRGVLSQQVFPFNRENGNALNDPM